ncbi:sulfotransferase [Actinoplanes sp. NPDC051470]|uniref:sulfotransferase family protein n=1 Tax=Actinoplanes sp. NPDC051470 TaxID=3157224 RepID=UPI003438A6A4
MIRVLYLAGSGRSGSTLVTTALGQVDGLFAAGELRYLWQRGLVEQRPCGCGQPLPDCPMWSAVLAKLPPREPASIAAGLRERLRMRNRLRVPPSPDDATITALYEAIHAHTGGAVIVDSSKLPPYGVLLAGLPGIDLRVLHVVRDPRAAAFSWRRRRSLDGDDRLMTRHPVWKAALLWTVWNGAVLRRWSRGAYLRVRYEDLVQDPQAWVRRIAAFAGAAPSSPLPFTEDGLLTLAPTHSVAGNPVRHRTGGVEVRADDEWRTAMSPRSFALVTALTSPLLRRLGYPFGRRAR